MDLAKMHSKIEELEAGDPEQFEMIKFILDVANKIADIDHICQLPPIVTNYHLDDEEEIHSYKLIATWTDMISFLKSKNINVRASFSAIA
jgi:hypothetical protein